MDYKSFRLSELKAVKESQGEFSGYAAIYGTKDRNEEIIAAGAMKKSIKESDGEFPLLWQHDKTVPIGVVRLEETDRGAKAKGNLNLGTMMGQQAYALMVPPEGYKRGALRDMSIGYIVHKDQIIDGIRHLKEIQLLEVSLVTVAAHPKTHVTAVKEYEAQGTRISRLELAYKTLLATLSNDGLLNEPGILHSLLEEPVDGAGPDPDEPSDAHSHDAIELLEEMRLYKVRSGIAYERDRIRSTSQSLGGSQASR